MIPTTSRIVDNSEWNEIKHMINLVFFKNKGVEDSIKWQTSVVIQRISKDSFYAYETVINISRSVSELTIIISYPFLFAFFYEVLHALVISFLVIWILRELWIYLYSNEPSKMQYHWIRSGFFKRDLKAHNLFCKRASNLIEDGSFRRLFYY